MFRSSFIAFALVLAQFGWARSNVHAQVLTDVPENAKDIKVDERLGTTLPSDLTFVDERGEPVVLGKLFDGRRPTIMTFNYSDCPGLCVAQLDGLAEGLKEMFGLALNHDFQVVSVSIDPRDTSEKLAKMKARYISKLTPEHQSAGWRFLTSSQKAIDKLTDAAGFRYSFDAAGNRYNHASVALLISPDGLITRYLYSVSFEPETLRLSLVEAGEGKIGTTTDQILLWCFHYNPSENRYSADAKRLLSFAAGAFVLIGLGISIPFWFSRAPGSSNASTPTIAGNSPQ